MIGFCRTDNAQGTPLSTKFTENILGILNNMHEIHHSHLTGEIIGFAYSICIQKVRENYFQKPVVAHSFIRFDCFFLLKVLRSGV